MKKVSVWFAVFLAACSGTQHPTPTPPHPYTVDVVAAPLVDDDAYTVVLPPVPDVRLNLSGDAGEQIAPLNRGQAAPFPGVLFNGAAAARLEVEFRGQVEQCRIDRQADLDRLGARATTDVRLLQTTINTQVQQYTLMLRSRDQELDVLYRQLQRPSNPDLMVPVLVGLGGLVLGAGIGLGIGLFHP